MRNLVTVHEIINVEMGGGLFVTTVGGDEQSSLPVQLQLHPRIVNFELTCRLWWKFRFHRCDTLL